MSGGQSRDEIHKSHTEAMSEPIVGEASDVGQVGEAKGNLATIQDGIAPGQVPVTPIKGA